MNKALPSRIFLTGFMGSGKSSIGKELASLMKRGFADTDDMVTRMAGKPVNAIFAQDGESTFRELETQVLQLVIRQADRQVIALGGGTICNETNLDLVLKNGFLIYLQLPAHVLAQRLESDEGYRPVLQSRRGEALLHTIEKKLEERKSFYERAHLMVNGMHLDAVQLYRVISASLPEANS